MPYRPSDANHWYYRVFKPSVESRYLLQNEPDDWSRLQVWDGKELKPAMGKGFFGEPTQAQIDRLYSHVQKNTLFFFKLDNPSPHLVEKDVWSPIAMDPRMPVPPQPPQSEDPTDIEKAQYAQSFNAYEIELNKCLKAQEVLKECGPAFKPAVDRFLAGRNPEHDRTERAARDAPHILENLRINRAKADRVISMMMAPRPVPPEDVFFLDERYADNATIDYEHYNNKLEPNGYDLPENSALTDYDAATINFAMLGASSQTKEVFAKLEDGYGPVSAEMMAKEGFHTMTTGLFGKPRINQPIQYCLGEAMKLGRESIEAYLAGDPTLLGQRLAECIRDMKTAFTGTTQYSVTESLTAATGMTERLLDLFERKPDILAATGLKAKELDFMRGYVQIGRIYDQYLDSQIRFAAATARGTDLSQAEKTEILVDAAIRRMVELELTRDSKAVETSAAYQAGFEAASEKDQAASEKHEQWMEENLTEEMTVAERDRLDKRHKNQLDVHKHVTAYMVQPVEHPIIAILAQPGTLERLRQDLKTDPAILEQAGKSPLAFTRDELNDSKKLDALVAQVQPTTRKAMWFGGFKSILAQGALDPRAAANSDRLMIAQDNGDGTKSLVSVASLLPGGLGALEDPDKNALDLMYEHAVNGNLYFYGKDKDMPARLSADGAQASARQLKVPKQPSLWMRFINTITFGRFYAVECNPKPDKDPAAFELFMDARASHTASPQKAVSPVQEQVKENQPEKTVQQPEKAKKAFSAKNFERQLEEYAAYKGTVVSLVWSRRTDFSAQSILDTMMGVARRSAAREILNSIKEHPNQKPAILAQSHLHFDDMIADIKEFLPKTYDPAELKMLVEKRHMAMNAQGEPLGMKFDFIGETALENYQNFVKAGKTNNFKQRRYDVTGRFGAERYCEPLGVKKDAQPDNQPEVRQQDPKVRGM